MAKRRRVGCRGRKLLWRMNEEGNLYHLTTPTYKCSFSHKDDYNLYFVTCYLTHDSWCRSQCSLLCLFPTDSVLSLRHDNTGMQTGQLCVRRVVLLKRLQRIFLLLQQLLERANTLIQRLFHLQFDRRCCLQQTTCSVSTAPR